MGFFNKDSEEMKIKKTIEANDFYNGIKCSFKKENPPFNKIVIYEFDESLNLKSDEISKIGYGLKNSSFDSIIQATDDGIIVKNATNNNNDLKIPFTNIIDAKAGNAPKELIISLVNGQKIFVSLLPINNDSLNGPKYVRNYMLSIIKDNALGKHYDEFINSDTTSKNIQLKDETPINIHEFGSPSDWARDEVAKVENQLLPILDKSGISRLTKTLETIAITNGYEEALEYLDYTTYRVDYYNKKKNDYLIEAKLADNIYKSYVTDGISRIDKVNGRFMATQNMKLDILIEQNAKIIKLLEEITKK